MAESTRAAEVCTSDAECYWRATGGGGAPSFVCPVLALRDWLDSYDTRVGSVLRKIDSWGSIEYHRFGTDAVCRILLPAPHPCPSVVPCGLARWPADLSSLCSGSLLCVYWQPHA